MPRINQQPKPSGTFAKKTIASKKKEKVVEEEDESQQQEENVEESRDNDEEDVEEQQTEGTKKETKKKRKHRHHSESKKKKKSVSSLVNDQLKVDNQQISLQNAAKNQEMFFKRRPLYRLLRDTVEQEVVNEAVTSEELTPEAWNEMSEDEKKEWMRARRPNISHDAIDLLGRVLSKFCLRLFEKATAQRVYSSAGKCVTLAWQHLFLALFSDTISETMLKGYLDMSQAELDAQIEEALAKSASGKAEKRIQKMKDEAGLSNEDIEKRAQKKRKIEEAENEKKSQKKRKADDESATNSSNKKTKA